MKVYVWSPSWRVESNIIMQRIEYKKLIIGDKEGFNAAKSLVQKHTKDYLRWEENLFLSCSSTLETQTA